MGAILVGIIKQVLIGKAAEALTTSTQPATKGILTSKTAWGAHITAAAAFFTALGSALNGEPTSIGIVVVTAIGWGTAIYGRYKAGGMF